MLDEILSSENIELALEHLMTKKDTCGLDGIFLSELKNYLALNQDTLFKKIRYGEYKPCTVEEIDILGYNGKS